MCIHACICSKTFFVRTTNAWSNFSLSSLFLSILEELRTLVIEHEDSRRDVFEVIAWTANAKQILLFGADRSTAVTSKVKLPVAKNLFLHRTSDLAILLPSARTAWFWGSCVASLVISCRLSFYS